MKAGMHTGLPMAEYLGLPAVSSGVVRAMMERCPRAAWFESYLNPERQRDHSNASDCGSIAHAILLEGSSAGVEVIDPNDHPAEKTGAIPEGWTNKSIRAARDAARAAGKIPVLTCDMTEIASIVDSALAFIDTLKHDEPHVWAAFQPDGGESEVTLVWNDNGTPCRARPDRISADRGLIIDAKFTGTSALPDAFGRHLTTMGYATSAGFYRRGTRALFGADTAYVFLVVETDPPYLCSLVGLDPAWTAFGDARASTGLQRWRACASTNHWPGYPTRVAYPEMPPWEQAKFEEEQINAGIAYDPAVLFGREAA